MKLTKEQKIEIQHSEKNAADLAKDFGVTPSTIARIKAKDRTPERSEKGISITIEDAHILIRIPRKDLTRKILSELI